MSSLYATPGVRYYVHSAPQSVERGVSLAKSRFAGEFGEHGAFRNDDGSTTMWGCDVSMLDDNLRVVRAYVSANRIPFRVDSRPASVDSRWHYITLAPR